MNRISKETVASMDKSGMLQKILEFPSQLLRGWEIGEEVQVGVDLGRFRNIVFGGMGGSAIAGDVVRSLLGDGFPVPLIVNRGYRLPGFVDSRTLFVASSYSGNTEETLTATQKAKEKGCTVLCVTSGGRLGEMAEENGWPLFRLPSGYPPRAALGYSLGVMLHFFRRLGVGEVAQEDLKQTITFLEKMGKTWGQIENSDNLPLILAGEIRGKIPLIYSSVEGLDGVGFRWKTQLNENGKTHAFYQPFPEMNHNEIVGWKCLPGTDVFFRHFIMVVLRIPEDSPRIRLRMDTTKQLVEKSGGRVLEVMGEGSSFLARLLYLIYLGDLLSFYLAILYEVDPTEIQKIDRLKKALSEHS